MGSGRIERDPAEQGGILDPAPFFVLLHARFTPVAAAAALGLGFASGFLPTLDAPGFELGLLLAVGCALLAPLAAIPAARAGRARPAPSPASAGLAAGALLALLASAAFAGSAIRAALGPCAAFTAAAWFVPVLTLPSALLGGAVASAAYFAAGGRAGRAVLLHALALASSLAVTLREAWAGPAAFGHDPFLGLWPGPAVLYDEPVRVDARALLWRGGALALAAAVLAGAELALRLGRPAGARRLGPSAAAFVLAGVGWLGASAALRASGLSGDRAAISHALGALRAGPRCTLVHAAGKPEAAAAALLAECEFHAADVARILGVASPPHITVFVYRSAAEKLLLVGAGRTDYVKPWHPEVHVVDQPLPHASLRHELVHALAASLAPGPLRVPARARLLPLPGLIEGLAVALDGPRGAFTVHEYAHAARDEGLLPDPVALLSPAAFVGQGPARSYSTAGSFVAWVLDRFGAAAVARAYADGDLPAATGRSWAELTAGWHEFLDAVGTPPGLRLAARARYTHRSAFSRRCAREETALRAGATEAAAAGRTEAACRMLERAGEIADPAAARKAAGDVLAQAGRLDEARRAYDSASEMAGDDVALRAAIATAEGDLAWRRGETAEAASRWRAALAAHPERADARLLEAKIAAAADPGLREEARPYLLGLGDQAVALARVARSPRPLAAYLVGRALLVRGEAPAAIPELERALAGGLGGLLHDEARLSLGEARCQPGRLDAGESRLGLGEAELRACAEEMPAAADRQRAALGVRRCAFEREARAGTAGGR